MNKRGAIEFSITTIIIIIIGISILALALPWVARMMQQTSQLTDTAFEQAKTQLAGELSAANPVVVAPSSLSLAANEQTTVSVGCFNSATAHVATLTGVETKAGLSTAIASAGSDKITVDTNGKYFWGIVIKAAANVDSTTAPVVMSLNVDCSGKPVTKPLMITFR